MAGINLPRDNRALAEIFKSAGMPEISEFGGEYSVDMLTVLPSLRVFSHRKVFYSRDDKILGHNVLFANLVWGRFFLEEGVCKEMDSAKAIVINYDRPENSFLSGRMIDYVRCVEKGALYLGRFNYVIKGKPRFLGYFSLTKRG